VSLRTSITTAGALLALVAPAAASARAITDLKGDVFVTVKHGASHKLSNATPSLRPDDRSGLRGA
jgi:hypothetical protein